MFKIEKNLRIVFQLLMNGLLKKKKKLGCTFELF